MMWNSRKLNKKAYLLLILSSFGAILWNLEEYPILQTFLQYYGDSNTTTTTTKTTISPFLQQQPQQQQQFIIPSTPDDSILRHIKKAIAYEGNYTTPSPLDHCIVTNQVRLEVDDSTGQWLLYSLHDGHQKTMGGDDFYVTYHDYADPNYNQSGKDPTGVAEVSDLGNGAYALEFLQPPMRNSAFDKSTRNKNATFQPAGQGMLTVYFVYTCFIGSWDFACKLKWLNNGASRAVHVLHNVTAPQSIRSFQIPPALNPATGDSVDVGTKIDFSKYDNVACFGDSVLRHFCGVAGKGGCPPAFHKDNMISFPHINSNILNASKANVIRRFESLFQGRMRSNGTTDALVLGSSAWDILFDVPDFEDHINGLREVLLEIQTAHPNLSLFWKSPQAFHVHRLTEACYTSERRCRLRAMLMSNSYVLDIYQRQKALMAELDIPFIDVFQASYLSAVWHLERDGVHYRKEFNWALVNLTYPLNHPETPLPECTVDVA